jgi:outer membrane protein
LTPEAPAVLTLEQALARARQLNSDNLASDAGYERQRAAQMQYRGQMLPRISLSGSADWRDSSLKDIDLSGIISPSQIAPQLARISNNSYNLQTEFRHTLFSGFTLLNRYREQVLRVRGADATRQDVRQRVDSMVKQMFASVLYRQQIVADRKQAVQAFTQALEIARAREKAGENTALDLLRAQTELRNAEAQLVEAQTDLIQGEQNLRRLIHLPLPEVPETERLQLAGTLAERSFDLSLADVRVRALELRQDFVAAKLQSSSAKRGVQAARGSYLPSVETFANYSWRSSYYDWTRELKGWTFGVVTSFNIFDGAQRLGAVRAELADARTADIRLKELQYQILSQLGELFATLQQSRSAIGLHRASVELGTRGLEQARRMYQIGQTELEELINAQLALQRAQANLARALLENNVAVAQLEYACGEWPQ